MLIYFPPLSISPQQSFYCGCAFHLVSSSGTKRLSSLMWNKHVKSEQQNSLGARLCSEGQLVMLISWTMTTPSVDTKAWSTHRVAILRFNLCGLQTIQSQDICLAICVLHKQAVKSMKTSCLLKGSIFSRRRLIWFGSHSTAKQVNNVLLQSL